MPEKRPRSDYELFLRLQLPQQTGSVRSYELPPAGEPLAEARPSFVDSHALARGVAPVRRGQKVWLKKAGPRNPRWRYALMGALATIARLDVLRPVLNPGGEAAIANEAARLRELAALGLRVPELLAVQTDGLLMSDLGTDASGMDNLLGVIARASTISASEVLRQWERGLIAIALVHARGTCLSQAFVRNLVACPDGVIGYIDFEDDPRATLSLVQCQARDWLSYLQSTATWIEDFKLDAAALALWRRTQREEPAGVAQALAKADARMGWLRRLPRGAKWGSDTARLRAAAGFLRAAVQGAG